MRTIRVLTGLLAVSATTVLAISTVSQWYASGPTARPERPTKLGPFPPPAANAQPVLSLPEDTFDAGTIEQGEMIRHLFLVRNDGIGDLLVRVNQPTCECITVSTGEDLTIAPGRSAVVPVSVDSAKFIDRLVSGVDGFTNDPKHPQISFLVRAKVKPEFVYPTSVDVGTARAGATVEQTFLVTSTAGSVVTSVSTTNPALLARLRRDKDSPGGVIVTVTLVDRPAVGEHIGVIVLSTSSRVAPELRIPALVNVTE